MAQEIVEAPITGTVISVEVKVGDKVEVQAPAGKRTYQVLEIK